MKSTMLCVLVLCVASHIAIADDSTDGKPVAPADTQTAPETAETSHPWRSAGAGCLGGATLGFILPGLGNAVGCVVGGFSAWLFNRRSDS